MMNVESTGPACLRPLRTYQVFGLLLLVDLLEVAISPALSQLLNMPDLAWVIFPTEFVLKFADCVVVLMPIGRCRDDL